MIVNIIGILIVIFGFFSPYLFPVLDASIYLHSYGHSVYFLWLGFLLILHPSPRFHKYKPHLNWGRLGILLNMFLFFSSHFIYSIILFQKSIYEGINITLMLLLKKLANPVRALFDAIIAVPSTTCSNGSVEFSYSFIRASFTDFFNILFFVTLGMCFTILFRQKKITSLIKWRQRPPH